MQNKRVLRIRKPPMLLRKWSSSCRLESTDLNIAIVQAGSSFLYNATYCLKSIFLKTVCFVLIESTPVGRCISPSAFPRTWKWFSVFFQLVRFLESTRSISSFNLSSARIALPERKGIVPFFLLKCHPHRSPSDPLRAYYVSSLVSHCRVYAHFSCPWLYR